MSKISPLKRGVLIDKLRKIGFFGPFSGARHQYMKRDNEKIFIPNPHGKDIGLPIIRKIITQVNINRDQWIKL